MLRWHTVLPPVGVLVWMGLSHSLLSGCGVPCPLHGFRLPSQPRNVCLYISNRTTVIASVICRLYLILQHDAEMIEEEISCLHQDIERAEKEIRDVTHEIRQVTSDWVLIEGRIRTVKARRDDFEMKIQEKNCTRRLLEVDGKAADLDSEIEELESQYATIVAMIQ